MKIMLISFVTEEDIMMEKEYDIEELPFIPRKGDFLEDDAFSYSNPAVVENVSINFDSGYTSIYLSKHNLVDGSQEHLEEILRGYEENDWIRTN